MLEAFCSDIAADSFIPLIHSPYPENTKNTMLRAEQVMTREISITLCGLKTGFNKTYTSYETYNPCKSIGGNRTGNIIRSPLCEL